MDNFLEGDIETFVYTKSLEIFGKLNNIQFNSDDIEIEKFPLSGISNTIYKVEIRYKNKNLHDIRNDQVINNTDRIIPIKHLFFKVFGRISVLVDRKLETYLMTKLHESGFGPKIYETDSKTYRVEEYFDNFQVLHPNYMLDPKILSKMIEIFSNLNIIGGEFDYYVDHIGNKTKDEFFPFLKEHDEKTNIVNFSLKMKQVAMKSFYEFKKRYELDVKKNKDQADWVDKLEHVEYTLINLENLLYEICPEQGIFVIGHNDSHPLNILVKSDHSKVVLCDFEYSSYNYMGFDIVNYIIESCYLLSADKFPFYQFYKEKLEILENDEGFEYFLAFFAKFKQDNSEVFNKHPILVELFKKCKSREYFYRLMGVSSLLWFTFAVIYYDYDSLKNQAGYDYLYYSLDRLMIYDKIAKPKIASQ